MVQIITMAWIFIGFFILMFLISRGTFDGVVTYKEFAIYTICGPVGWGLILFLTFRLLKDKL